MLPPGGAQAGYQYKASHSLVASFAWYAATRSAFSFSAASSTWNINTHKTHMNYWDYGKIPFNWLDPGTAVAGRSAQSWNGRCRQHSGPCIPKIPGD